MNLKKAVILTAIRCEYLAVHRHLENCEEEVHDQGTVYEVGRFEDWDILIAELGAGNEKAASEAERAIAYFNPHVVFFVGVAGGLKDVNLGDVVAATKVYGYEYGKDEKEFKPRPEAPTSAAPLQSRAKAEARKTDWLKRRTDGAKQRVDFPTVLVAPIAAGSKVVASTKSVSAKKLKALYSDAVAVEMEGFGFQTAAALSPAVYAMVIRGISDLIDEKSTTDADGWQSIAADHASAFAFQMLSKLRTENLLHP
jgi:nucleoside phosphorylase